MGPTEDVTFGKERVCRLGVREQVAHPTEALHGLEQGHQAGPQIRHGWQCPPGRPSSRPQRLHGAPGRRALLQRNGDKLTLGQKTPPKDASTADEGPEVVTPALAMRSQQCALATRRRASGRPDLQPYELGARIGDRLQGVSGDQPGLIALRVLEDGRERGMARALGRASERAQQAFDANRVPNDKGSPRETVEKPSSFDGERRARPSNARENPRPLRTDRHKESVPGRDDEVECCSREVFPRWSEVGFREVFEERLTHARVRLTSSEHRDTMRCQGALGAAQCVQQGTEPSSGGCARELEP